MREDRLDMKEDWSERSITFIVESKTGCPVVGNEALDDCKELSL